MAVPEVITLTQKMRAFTLRVFQTNEPTDSYMTVYKCKSKQGAAVNASKMLKKTNVQAYLAELRQQTVDDSIMSVKERKQRLSQFGREDIRNAQGTLIRHGSIAAMDLLNKMGGDYAPEKVDLTEGLTELLGQLRGRVVPEIGQTGQDAGDGEK